ncbi:hypothetical protein HO173_009552 [Letharia columbiana]|uniref:Rhodopsin domain-containing protein n=1 Tax=Letharia columbiana TaxID=112416 RepID=A0A8H6FP87_9LECA|nr:uncharacterized protein HO173_009552 [Letharia columbiana]KAF6232169.1 hypothetical protein HO173_009552 [Letharia columbiana]
MLCQESQQSSLLAMEWFFTIVAIIVVSLRLYCRTKFGKGFYWDDYTFVASVIIGLPDPFLVTKWVHTGLGKHIECLGPARAYATIQWSIAAQAQHIVCLGLVKASLCLCVLRVIDRVERRIATFLWVNIALVGAIHVAQLAMLLAECRPLNALWDPKVNGRCYSPKTAYTTTYVAFSLDAFTDLVCSGIPTFVLYRMQMNTRTKVALCVLMGLGVFTAMCAVAKAITLKEIWSRDFTWNAVIVVKWACAEQALSLILVSLPILRPLFRNFFTLTKAGRSPPKAPARGSRFHRIPPPNLLLFKSTNDSSSLRKGNIAPYASIQVLYADRRLPQMPLVARQVQPRVELERECKI